MKYIISEPHKENWFLGLDQYDSIRITIPSHIYDLIIINNNITWLSGCLARCRHKITWEYNFLMFNDLERSFSSTSLLPGLWTFTQPIKLSRRGAVISWKRESIIAVWPSPIPSMYVIEALGEALMSGSKSWDLILDFYSSTILIFPSISCCRTQHCVWQPEKEDEKSVVLEISKVDLKNR